MQTVSAEIAPKTPHPKFDGSTHFETPLIQKSVLFKDLSKSVRPSVRTHIFNAWALFQRSTFLTLIDIFE